MAEERPDYYRSVFANNYTEKSSEDGLYLNLWTPSLDGSKRPVLVFLHGGGFWTGQATRPRENGSRLASEQDVVVVAPTHRLGVMGYLDVSSIIEGDANVGMSDIVLALEWVRDNVQGFGGDPDCVTVFGESGGSLKVATLLAMPSARGLFHRAICQSGAYPLAGINTRTGDAADRKLLAAELEAQGLDLESAELLREVPADRLVAALEGDAPPWAPRSGTTTLPEDVLSAVEAGAAANVPLLIGTNRDEMRVLCATTELPGNREELASKFNESLADYYVSTSKDFETAVERAMTDYTFRIPSIRFAEMRARSASAPVYMYLFNWENLARPDVGATHGMETPFLFGTTEVISSIHGAEGEEELSLLMRNVWASFARYGHPGRLGPTADWTPFDDVARATMVFDKVSHVEKDPLSTDRLAWASTEL